MPELSHKVLCSQPDTFANRLSNRRVDRQSKNIRLILFSNKYENKIGEKMQDRKWNDMIGIKIESKKIQLAQNTKLVRSRWHACKEKS